MAALHERLNFDTAHGQVLDADRRYVLLRADVLMGLFAHLPAPERDRALDAFGASVFERGSASVRAYAATVSGGAEALFETVAEGGASLGWGAWRVEHHAGGTRLRVRNSPFAQFAPGHDRPCCAPIAGMFRAVCEHAWNAPATVTELDCVAMHPSAGPAASECLFEAVKTASRGL
jgi:predicted hydrocarbon binding protein